MATSPTSRHSETAARRPLPEPSSADGERAMDPVATATILNEAPRRAAQRLGLDTVLASRVMPDGEWIPWARYGDYPAPADSAHAWPACTRARWQSSCEATLGPDDLHPAVADVLARSWVLAPIEREHHLIGFLHAHPRAHKQQRGGYGTCYWQPLWTFAEELAAECVASSPGEVRTQVPA